MPSLQSPLARFLVLLAVVVCFVSLGLNVASLAVPRWLMYSVNSTKAGANATSNHLYYNRTRGLFLTCMVNTNSPVLSISNYAAQVKTYTTCFDMDLGNLNSSGVDFIGDQSVLLLRRWHLGLQLAAAVVMLIALVLLISSLVFRNALALFGTSALCTLAEVPQAACLLVFHNTLTAEMLIAQPNSDSKVYANWPDAVKTSTQVNLGVSYGLACGSAGAILLASCLCMSLGCKLACGGASAADKSDAMTPPDAYGYHASAAASYVSGPPSQRSAAGSRLPRTPIGQHPQMY